MGAQPRNLMTAALLAAWAVAAHARALGFGFVGFDDWELVSENPHVLGGLGGEGLRWAFTGFGYAASWLPLAWLSHMLDVDLFGLDARGHHATSLLLHGLGSALLFLALRALTRQRREDFWPSVLVAALFAAHPLRVESVVWISERKDVLSGVFFGLTLLAWAHYVRRPGPGRYAGVALVLALGLMAKPMLVTLPCVLLLLDVWPLRRWSPLTGEGRRCAPPARLLWEKLPLLALCAASCAVTALAQRVTGTLSSVEQLGGGERLANALLAWVAYLKAAFWPVGLAPFYPHPATLYPDALARMLPAALAAGGLLLAVTLLSLARLRSRPYLAVGWLWYVGMLVPVIGLVQVGNQSHADRYAYLPLVGIQIALAFGLRDLWSARPRLRRLLAAGAAALVVLSAALTWRQTGIWRDDVTLFGHALAVTPDNYLAHYNLANHFLRSGRPASAEAHFRETLRIKPRHARAAANLGVALAQQGRADEAQRALARALDLDPRAATPHVTLGLLAAQERRYDRAEQHLRRALELDPANADAHNDLGALLLLGGRFHEAAALLERAVALSPRSAGAHANLGYARLRLHDVARAEAALRRALEIEPGMALALRHLEALRLGEAGPPPASRIP